MSKTVRYAYLLGTEKLVMPSLSETAIAVMGNAYPDVVKNRDFVVNVLAREGDVAAVDGVSLEIKKGEFLSFLGPSGSGYHLQTQEASWKNADHAATARPHSDTSSVIQALAHQRRRRKNANSVTTITPSMFPSSSMYGLEWQSTQW